VQEGEGPEEEISVLGDTVPLALLRRAAQRHTAMVTEVPAGDHGTARLLTTPLPGNVGEGVLLVSYPLREVAALLARARFHATLAILAALIVSLVAGYFLARNAMRPVAAMSNRAALIGAANLHERVPIHNPRDELGILATTLNGLLDRVAEALDQQRRFMADASHELRTPVAIMRGETDIALGSATRSAEEYREALTVVHKAAIRLGHTVEDIFLLALVDAKEAPVVPAPIYLDDLVADACRAMRSLAEGRGITIDCATSAEAAYVGDEQLLQRLIANLLDNAIKYSPPGGSITVRFDRTGDWYALSVSNGGPGIPPEAREHVFDRFFRLDSARTVSIGTHGRVTGSGLGLPIARWIAERHGGTLELSESTEARTSFTLRLPVEPVLERTH
jgi:signal transduction histidine kinase